MQELEKILEEIEIKIAGSMGKKREGLLEAEDIIRRHMNDGWIPVEERLPEDGTYLCTLAGELCGIENGIWDEPDCVIAWRPLPDPYRLERSAKNA